MSARDLNDICILKYRPRVASADTMLSLYVFTGMYGHTYLPDTRFFHSLQRIHSRELTFPKHRPGVGRPRLFYLRDEKTAAIRWKQGDIVWRIVCRQHGAVVQTAVPTLGARHRRFQWSYPGKSWLYWYVHVCKRRYSTAEREALNSNPGYIAISLGTYIYIYGVSQ